MSGNLTGEGFGPPHQWLLLHDPEDGDWSLWQVNTRTTSANVVVNWHGNHPGHTFDIPTGQLLERFVWHHITDEQAESCIMAAKHLATSEAWWRYARSIMEGD